MHFYGNVVYAYVYTICEERFESCWWSFSWLDKKVKMTYLSAELPPSVGSPPPSPHWSRLMPGPLSDGFREDRHVQGSFRQRLPRIM